MKLTNVLFIRPIIVAGLAKEMIQASEGYVEELDFPWCRVVVHGKTARRTTVFNIAACDDFVEEPKEPAKGKGK